MTAKARRGADGEAPIHHRPRSLVDAFALALAKHLDAIPLTGDGALRGLAAREAMECLGLLWLFDAMEGQGVLSRRSLQRG
jgi:hypothetical protein